MKLPFLLSKRSKKKPYRDQVIGLFGTSLLAYWPLDETSGNTAINYGTLGAGANGTYGAAAAAPTLASLAFPFGGQCPLFDGGDYVNIATAALVSGFSKLEGSLLAWFYVRNAKAYGTMMRLAGDNPASISVSQPGNTTGNSVFQYNNGTGVSLTRNYASTPGNWYLVAINWTKTGNAVTAWMNAVQLGETVAMSSDWTTAIYNPRCVIGAADATGGDAFDGYVAHVCLLNRPATEAEMTAMKQNSF